MPTISVRQLSVAGDPQWGLGTGNFIYDIYAVAQILSTTLKLWVGEWFQSLGSGVAYLNNAFVNGPYILGYPNGQASAASALLQQAILGVPYVTSISAVETGWDAQTRVFIFTCVVNTVFGPISVATAPGLSASIITPNSSSTLF